MLMQAYRRAYSANGKSKRLSQEGLLLLMGEADSRYLDSYDRSTVARWESGDIGPNRERLEVFGIALDLSPAEIEGLIRLAGLEPDDAGPAAEIQSLVEPANTYAGPSVDTLEDTVPGGGCIRSRWGSLSVLRRLREAVCFFPVPAARVVRCHCRLLSGVARLELLIHVGPVRRRNYVPTDSTGVPETAPV